MSTFDEASATAPSSRPDIAVLRRAIELGINLLDTADSYGPYVSGDLIREALHPYCTRAGLGCIPWSPLAIGRLANPDGPLARAAWLGALPAPVAIALRP